MPSRSCQTDGLWAVGGGLSVKVSAAVRVPVAVGVKVTEIEQLEPAAERVPAGARPHRVVDAIRA